MASQNTQVGICAYCEVYGEITKDHVIPRGFFGTPPPGNIPKVPACPNCNNKVKSADDQYVCHLFAADMSLAEHPVIQANIEKMLRSEKQLQSKQKGLSTLAKALPLAQRIEVYSPGGIYIGRANRIPVDQKRVLRFARTIVRGLYFYHCQRSLPPDVLYNVRFGLKREQASFLDEIFLKANSPHIQVGDGSVFEYVYNVSPDDPLNSRWLLNFYEHSIWTVGTRSPNSAIPAR